jgi:BirA family transcriptional regulator, biotin operon repressor / biotin---[acetyl-CoA-carboxylase] ligase
MSRGVFELSRLSAAVKPFRLYFFSRLRSTNDHAASMRRRGDLFAPAIVVTPRQIAGRGRGSNRWFSRLGGDDSLTVTFALPLRERIAAPEIPIIAGLAVRDAAELLTGRRDIRLKWPNDVICQGRKLAGLLCERVDHADLIGVGVNLNLDPADAPANLRQRITSLKILAGRRLDATDALASLADHLHRSMRKRLEQPFSVFLRQYREHDGLIGKSVLVTGGEGPPLAGKCQGVDDKGRLLIRRRGTLYRVVAGTVVLKGEDR